eukprot:3642133-Amphidinium_carterae.1
MTLCACPHQLAARPHSAEANTQRRLAAGTWCYRHHPPSIFRLLLPAIFMAGSLTWAKGS